MAPIAIPNCMVGTSANRYMTMCGTVLHIPFKCNCTDVLWSTVLNLLYIWQLKEMHNHALIWDRNSLVPCCNSSYASCKEQASLFGTTKDEICLHLQCKVILHSNCILESTICAEVLLKVEAVFRKHAAKPCIQLTID